MGDQVTELITIIGVVTVPRRIRRLLNLAVGILIASAFTVVGALWLDSWAIVPAGVLAGILAAVEAGKAHDAGDRGKPAESALPPRRGSP
jgi:hypothetical protein